MIDETLQDRAALYASGGMTPEERGQFELILEFHDELRAFTDGMSEVAASITLAANRPDSVRPSAALKSRIIGVLRDTPQQGSSDSLVVSGPDGLVRWINPAFTAMCGYSFDELRGKKLGPILQGEKTDRRVSERMRRAVHECRPCRETILNYHKNGTPYWAEIAITPILDDAGRPLWLVAREREVPEPAAA